jgi:hypothetical protein
MRAKARATLLITVFWTVLALTGVATQARSGVESFGEAPQAPAGPLSVELERDVLAVFGPNLRDGPWGEEQVAALQRVASSGDTRLGWLLSDLMRVTGGYEQVIQLTDAATELLGIEGLNPRNPWGRTTDHLIAWDIPAPPGYLELKRGIYTLVEPEWSKLFVEGEVDWRLVTWGGVGIDDRPFGTKHERCNCIPAADAPEVTDAGAAGWLKDGDIVFGVVVNDEARAYPRRIMEVREMVNDTLGGRHIGIPYCTLCGSAQAWFTDGLPDGVERPVLRTSGLLVRSNKVMFDLNTWSMFDTFLGTALTGPLAERGVTLQQTSVITTTWGRWKEAHPETTVLDEKLALGEDFDFRNTRDADGPIFPIGNVDARLPAQQDVLGVVTASGTPIAFHNEAALAALERGEEVTLEDVRLILEGGGLKAVDTSRKDLGGHLAFWFAWSQFHPGTELWTGP